LTDAIYIARDNRLRLAKKITKKNQENRLAVETENRMINFIYVEQDNTVDIPNDFYRVLFDIRGSLFLKDQL